MATSFQASNFPTGGTSGTITDPVTGLSTVVTTTAATGGTTFTDSGTSSTGNFGGGTVNAPGTVAGTFNYAFTQSVDNVSFSLSDIDESLPGGWDDRVSIRAFDADNNVITGVTTFSSNSLGGALTHAVGTNGDGSNYVEGTPASNNDDAFVSISGANIYRIEVSFETGSGGVQPARVGVGDFTLDIINDAPVAEVDAETTLEDTAVIVDLTGNDSDPEGDTLTVTGITSSLDGSITNNSDGTLTFTPDSNFTGSTTVTYTISDGNGGTATATATIDVVAVNDIPVAVADTTTTDEDTAVVVDLIANDSDIEGDDLTVLSVTSSVNGSVVNNSDGTITFTPNSNFTGTTSVTYTISDGNGGTASATHTIDVDPVNDIPVAENDTTTTDEDTAVVVDLIANDSDIEGDDLTVLSVTSSANGSVVNNSDGTITFTPNSNFTGTTSVTYTISDGNGGTASATHTIDVDPVKRYPCC